MHRTENASRLPLLSGSKGFRRYFILLLALAATSVFGQGSVLTLAMVRYDQSPAQTPVVARNNSEANLLCYDASAPRLQHLTLVLKFDNQNTADFLIDSRLDKQGISNHHDLLPLVHKKLYADGRMGKWMDVAAGYGQVYQFESGLAKNTVDLQRPGFAYLRASFSF